MKNTESGSVVLSCRIRGSKLRIDVCDTGSGVSDEKLKKMLQPYQREEGYSGTGLGLSIVRQLCDQHGLNVDFVSVEGKGSIVSVLVPRVMKRPSGSSSTTAASNFR